MHESKRTTTMHNHNNHYPLSPTPLLYPMSVTSSDDGRWYVILNVIGDGGNRWKNECNSFTSDDGGVNSGYEK